MKKLLYGTSTSGLERELALKTKELLEIQRQCDQLQKMLLELPILKKDLQKSRLETKGISEVLFASRKETAQLKDLVNQLNKQIKSKEMLSENCKELQKSLENVTQERDQNASEVERLGKLVEQKDNEIQRNKNHCITLKGLVDRLEVRNFKYPGIFKFVLPYQYYFVIMQVKRSFKYQGQGSRAASFPVFFFFKMKNRDHHVLDCQLQVAFYYVYIVKFASYLALALYPFLGLLNGVCQSLCNQRCTVQ